MQARFETMSNTIVGRLDELSSRIDALDGAIGDLMNTTTAAAARAQQAAAGAAAAPSSTGEAAAGQPASS